VLGQHGLKPGESTELTIVYNTYKFPGKFEKYVTVFTDSDATKELQIDMHGFVKAIPMGVLAAAPRKVEIGTVKVGKTASGTIVLNNTGDAAMKVTRVVSKKHKTVYYDGEVTIPVGGSHPFPISVTAKKPGRYLDFVMVHSDARNVTKKGYKVIVTATAE
jgi:hypothetical protein